jgi:FKBP-type peptidyl-prolyl cis-trans isomerase (trigger factor)
MGQSIKISGFRPGKVPKEVILKNVGEQAILEEAAQIAIRDTYPKALDEKELLIIDAPVIKIGELKSGEVLEYTLTAPVPPKFKTPDYAKHSKKIFDKVIEIEVTDKEITESTLDLRKRRKQIELVQAGTEPQKAQEEANKVKETDLPELDAEFLEALGGFKSLDEFKIQLKETIKKEKEAKELNKRRAKFVDAVVDSTDISLPPVLISHELDRLKGQFEVDLQQVGSTLDAYLQSSSKSLESFLEELRPQAIKQAKLQLILNKIAETENLIPDAGSVDKEVKHMLEHYKDANEDSLRAYVTMQMRNRMVFDFLEGTDKSSE